jgi:hypothetical protein
LLARSWLRERLVTTRTERDTNRADEERDGDMIRYRSSLHALGILLLALVILAGCGRDDDQEPPDSQNDQPPIAQITAPADGAVLPAGQAVVVSVIAQDDQAVVRIELYVDGSLVESRVTPEGSAFTTVSEAFNWSASIIGAHSLQARAYDSSGQMGASRILGVQVALPGTTPIPPEGGSTSLPGTPSGGDSTTPLPPTVPAATSTVESAQVTANVEANVRSGPGTNYTVVGGLGTGEKAPVTGRNADSSWWQISYQGGVAWIADSVSTANQAAYGVPVAEAPPPPPPTSTSVPPTATPAPQLPTNPPAPVSGLSADQTNLNAGQCTELRWDFPGMKAFYISLGYGYDKEVKPTTSSYMVCPSITTTYETTVVRPDDTQDFPSLTINVSGGGCGDPYITRFSPTTDRVSAGQPFSIFWDVDCAKAVYYIREGGGEEPVGGHDKRIDVTINKDTLFQLKVKRSNGDTHNASFTVRTK